MANTFNGLDALRVLGKLDVRLMPRISRSLSIPITVSHETRRARPLLKDRCTGPANVSGFRDGQRSDSKVCRQGEWSLLLDHDSMGEVMNGENVRDDRRRDNERNCSRCQGPGWLSASSPETVCVKKMKFSMDINRRGGDCDLEDK